MTKSYRSDLHGGNPYYDDFNEDKKFVRIMSRPGFPLQAREVTQLQSILQTQVERLGDHFFEDGAVVNGGEITEASAVAVRLDGTTYTLTELESFVNKTVRNAAGVQAQIIAVADKSSTLSDDQFQILFVNYVSGSSFSGGDTLTIEGTLPLEQPKVKVASTGTNDPEPTSVASNVICISPGIFYADGFLLKNDAGTIAASKVTNGYRDFENPSSSVGFEIVRELITSEDDETLKDPSFGFYNFNSPGADRYKVDLRLKEIPFTGAGLSYDSEDYFELVKIVQGQTTKQVRFTDYAIFEDTLARRTYDESGHYTVSPFQVNPVSHSDAFGTSSETQHAIKVSAGKAYVGGYEFERITPSFFPIDRALTPDTLRLAQIQTPLENYVTVLRDSAFDSITTGANRRETFTKQRKATVQKDDNGTITNLGTCNIRTIQEMANGEIRLYLFNIKMNSGKKFSDSTHIAIVDGDETDNRQRYRIGTTDTETVLEGLGTPRQIFKAPIGSGLITTNREDLVSKFLVKKAYTFDLSASGEATISSTKKFLEGAAANHVIFYSDATSGNGATMMRIGTDLEILVNNTNSTRTLSISTPAGSGVPASGEGTIIASQLWESDARGTENNIRQKTITEQEETDLLAVDAVGGTFESVFNLSHPDAFELVSVVGGDGNPITDAFELDPNQTSEAYFNSRLVLKAGFTCATDSDTGKLSISTVNYKRFSHSGDGPFTVDSYPVTDTFTYNDIPRFTDTETGESYSLADAFDFRPVSVDQDNTFDNGSGSSQVVAFENGVDIPFVSYDHYLSRIDRLVLGNDRGFRIVSGIPSVNPKAPITNENDMVLGEFTIPPFTSSADDIKYRYIDNQRTTMSEINELEKSQQFDQYYSFVNDLEQEALNRAMNFRNSRTANTDGVFVDTFVGHNNAVTAKRDHNCSIDPEFGEVRPAFESSFHHMGLTGVSLSNDTVKTADNIYMLDSNEAEYSAAPDSSTIIEANQFGVPDYQGTMTLTPSSDPYFSVTSKPKVIVNTVGEVDNWETSINAFQRGRTRGFGSQWRDWETLWFGSRKRNDVNIEHESSGSEYTRPRTSSFISRVLSDKLIRKIGEKIVDLSVVPFARSRSIQFTAKNLLPNERHVVFFDGIRVVADTGPTDSNGEVSGSFTVTGNTFLTGKKLVRIIDRSTRTSNTDDSLTLARSSADIVYHAEGLLETKSGDIYSVRPELTRRKAANSEDISDDYFDANAPGNLSATFNSQTPLAQELFVDPSEFPNGIMLKNVELFFSSVAITDETVRGKPPVKVSVRPLYNGAPHPYKVLPFSEVTKNVSDLSVANFDSPSGDGTKFEFSTPVYLRPNRSYAICISTNSPDYKLFMGIKGQRALIGTVENNQQTDNIITAPQHIGPMHIPQNNGASYKTENQYFKMFVNRCDFSDRDANEVLFKTSLSTTKPYHVLHIHTPEQIDELVRGRHTITTASVGGGDTSKIIDLNTTIDDFNSKKIISTTSQLRLTSSLAKDSKSAICTMIDGDRIGAVAVEYMANNDDAAAIVEESQPTARLATNRSRYVSRKVTLNEKADDVVVTIDGSFVGNSQVKVYIKTQGPDQPESIFDDNAYEELFPEGNAGTPTSGVFTELKPKGSVGGVIRFTTDNTSPGLKSGEFTKYQLKVVLLGEDVNNTGNASQIPVINSISAVPLRRISQDEIRRYTPAGTILAWSTSTAPFGFILCNGASYNYVENPEYKILFDAIGYTYGGSGNSFNVPDLRGKSIVGTKSLSDNDSPAAGLGTSFGVDKLTLDHKQVPLPPHYHGYGLRTEQGANNNDVRLFTATTNGRSSILGIHTGIFAADHPGDGSGGSSSSRGHVNNLVPNGGAGYGGLITSFALRPSDAARSNMGHGDDEGCILSKNRNSFNVYDEDVPLDKVSMHQPSLTLNYIIKI